MLQYNRPLGRGECLAGLQCMHAASPLEIVDVRSGIGAGAPVAELEGVAGDHVLNI